MKILAGGCFNLIHRGHVFFFKQCRALGDELNVVLTNDKNNHKQSARPIDLRIRNLARLNMVDHILEGTPQKDLTLIKKIKPEIIVSGYDQRLSSQFITYAKNHKIKLKKIPRLKNYQKKNNWVIARMILENKSGLTTLLPFLEEKIVKSPAVLVKLIFCREFFKNLIQEEKVNRFNWVNALGINSSVSLYETEFMECPEEKDWEDLAFKRNKLWIILPSLSNSRLDIALGVMERKIGENLSSPSEGLIEVIF